MAKPKYIRDKRSPKPKSDAVSKVMSANKSKGTKPEVTLRKILWAQGIRGYRINYKKIPGRPDIAFTKTKIAIFVNGCFWHQCPKCNYAIPKHNQKFWKEKFEKNIARDERKAKELQEAGWKVITIWECELKLSQIQRTMNLIRKQLLT